MHDDTAFHAPVDAAGMAMRNRCPRCGGGGSSRAFSRSGRPARNCGLDYAFIDSGDGPAVFVILIISFIVVGLALYTEVTLEPAALGPFPPVDSADRSSSACRCCAS